MKIGAVARGGDGVINDEELSGRGQATIKLISRQITQIGEEH